MALHLPRTFTLLHPYNGHIPRIFLDVHVIFLIQAQCATAQTGPQLQIILFGLLHEDYAACHLLLADARTVRSSRIFGYRPEDKRRLCGPLFTRRDAPVDRSSRVFVFRSEDKRRRKSSVYAPEVLARLRLPTRRQAKAGISCVHSRCRLRYSFRPVFSNLQRMDRRWCPQQ